jgi:coniferyl-aldehyde dehydrogenase
MNSIGNMRRPVPEDSRNGLRALLEAQRLAFREHPPQYSERLHALRALERVLTARQGDLTAAISKDFGGRAAEETLALEVLPLLNEIRHARRHLKRWMAPHREPVQWQCWPGKARTIHQPLGVVGIVSPWNYPLLLSLAPLTGALAAGNHVLLKPSEAAPATAKLIQSMVSELYEPDYVRVITGGVDTAAEFVRLPLDHLLFTGSARVGKLVMQAASENLVPVTLELGGKSPAIVHSEYPVQRAADRILTGKLYNAGQTCVAPDYVLLPHHHRDEFVDAAQRAIAGMFPALVNNQDYTRIINAQHHRRLADLVDDARNLGAQVIEVNPAGEACDGMNRVFPPTLVTNVREDMALMQEEIFGPVLPIVEYRSVEEAFAYVNARPHPLALYYFDNDRHRIDDMLRLTYAGGVTVNDCLFHVAQTSLPFGGVGPSGMGRYHGFDGFQTFSNRKGVFVQARRSAIALLRPPYSERTRQIIKFLIGG